MHCASTDTGSLHPVTIRIINPLQLVLQQITAGRILVEMRISLLMALIMATAVVPGCNERNGDYIAAAAISENGFARSAAMPAPDGQPIKLRGFVDYSNLFGDTGARSVLGDLWSGGGPGPATWRFNLKAHEDDPAGNSFAVHVPNDETRDAILGIFVANARAKKPTRVFLKGKVFTFAAPTNFVRHTGLYVELASSGDILFTPGE